MDFLSSLALLGIGGYAIYNEWQKRQPDKTVYGPVQLPDDPTSPVVTNQGNNVRGDTFLDAFRGLSLTPFAYDDPAGLSSPTLPHPKDAFDLLIWDMHREYFRQLPPSVIKAFCFVESSFVPSALRSEPGLNDESVGLMQLLTATAKWLEPSFAGMTKEQIRQKLFNPQINVSLGCKYIMYQQGRYGTVKGLDGLQKVAAAYNAGSVKLNKDGDFINRAYVNKIVMAANSFERDFPVDPSL